MKPLVVCGWQSFVLSNVIIHSCWTCKSELHLDPYSFRLVLQCVSCWWISHERWAVWFLRWPDLCVVCFYVPGHLDLNKFNKKRNRNIFHYLLTPWSRVLLEKLTSKLCSLFKKFPAFMEPESSSPYPQLLATRPYPEPTPSSPHDPLQLPEDPS